MNAKSWQGYSVNAGIPQVSTLEPTLFILYIKDFPDDVICKIAIFANGTTFCSKCE